MKEQNTTIMKYFIVHFVLREHDVLQRFQKTLKDAAFKLRFISAQARTPMTEINFFQTLLETR